VDEVEAAYCHHLNILTMRDVDHISEFLLSHVTNPFPHFMKFMKRECEAVARLVENQPAKKRLPRFERSRVKG
jgi:hypothetical protein